ncbi:hypothetical protein ACFX15_027447 [Malus domestica]
MSLLCKELLKTQNPLGPSSPNLARRPNPDLPSTSSSGPVHHHHHLPSTRSGGTTATQSTTRTSSTATQVVPKKAMTSSGSGQASPYRPYRHLKILRGHEDPVACVKYSNDGTLLASASLDKTPPSVADPEVHEIMQKEKHRQFKGIELVASENFVCRVVMEALGSHLTNKYSEGMPEARYYTGNQHIDQIELLCHERALAAFGLDPEKWGVNVQPYSCTSANIAVYTGLLLPNDRIMGLDSPSGGHMSHGYYTSGGKKVTTASIFFDSFPYKVNPQTGYIDFDKLEERAVDYRPKILICGGSSYPREWDYARFRHIADKCGAVLMCDMAHISGLVAAKECASPF